jgi:hypothetical protein
MPGSAPRWRTADLYSDGAGPRLAGHRDLLAQRSALHHSCRSVERRAASPAKPGIGSVMGRCPLLVANGQLMSPGQRRETWQRRCSAGPCAVPV